MIDTHMIQRVALYLTLGILLSAFELTYETVGFWLVIALYWANEHMTERHSFEQGIATGIEMMTDMTEEQRADVIALVKQAQDDSNE
jgi:hypothetical protein